MDQSCMVWVKIAGELRCKVCELKLWVLMYYVMKEDRGTHEKKKAHMYSQIALLDKPLPILVNISSL